jgi:hypothetical protein
LRLLNKMEIKKGRSRPLYCFPRKAAGSLRLCHSEAEPKNLMRGVLTIRQDLKTAYRRFAKQILLLK